MRVVFAIAASLAIFASTAAFATNDKPTCPKHYTCNSQGVAIGYFNPEIKGGNGGAGGEGGKGGNAVATNVNKNTDVNVNKNTDVNLVNAKGGNSRSNSVSKSNSVSSVRDSGNSSNRNDNSADNSSDVDVNVQNEGDTYINKQVRQAPSVFQGSFAISGCAVAGNAGGSNTHGSAFLGFGFTPAECYAFMLAQAYQAIGDTRAACEVLRTTNAAKRVTKRGAKLPGCDPEVVVVPQPAVVEVEKVIEVPRYIEVPAKPKAE